MLPSQIAMLVSKYKSFMKWFKKFLEQYLDAAVAPKHHPERIPVEARVEPISGVPYITDVSPDRTPKEASEQRVQFMKHIGLLLEEGSYVQAQEIVQHAIEMQQAYLETPETKDDIEYLQGVKKFVEDRAKKQQPSQAQENPALR
jgi:hypothetical protein